MKIWILIRILIRRIYKRKWIGWNSSAYALSVFIIVLLFISMAILLEASLNINGFVKLSLSGRFPLAPVAFLVFIVFFFVFNVLSKNKIDRPVLKRLLYEGNKVPKSAVQIILIILTLICVAIIVINVPKIIN